MKEAANDNTDTWIKLAAATANLVRYLEPKQNPDQEADRPEPEKKERSPEAERERIERRLKEIAALEGRLLPRIKGRR